MKYLLSDCGILFWIQQENGNDYQMSRMKKDFRNDPYVPYDTEEIELDLVFHGLSREVVEMVLKYVLIGYMKNNDYLLVMDLMTRFSKTFTRTVFYWIFGVKGFRDHFKICNKLSNTMLMISIIHGEYLRVKNIDHHTNFQICFGFSKKGCYQPWDLVLEHHMLEIKEDGRIDWCGKRIKFKLEQLSFYAPIFSIEDSWNQIICGKSVADIVWILGEHGIDGFLHGSRELFPVVVMKIVDSDGNALDMDVYEKKENGWDGFKFLMMLMFGENTGIFYRVKDPYNSVKLKRIGYLFEG